MTWQIALVLQLLIMGWFRWSYIVIPIIVILTAVVGGQFTNEGLSSWYLTIDKPEWTPSGAIIGTVWTVLYTLIAISAILFWNNAPRGGLFWAIVALFLVNAVLNAGWNYVFFARHAIGGALVEIAVLEATILALIGMLWPLARLSSLLLVPYAAWVAFASYLTYAIWALNK